MNIWETVTKVIQLLTSMLSTWSMLSGKSSPLQGLMAPSTDNSSSSSNILGTLTNLFSSAGNDQSMGALTSLTNLFSTLTGDSAATATADNLSKILTQIEFEKCSVGEAPRKVLVTNCSPSTCTIRVGGTFKGELNFTTHKAVKSLRPKLLLEGLATSTEVPVPAAKGNCSSSVEASSGCPFRNKDKDVYEFNIPIDQSLSSWSGYKPTIKFTIEDDAQQPVACFKIDGQVE